MEFSDILNRAMNNPFVSVIIAARNGQETLEKCLVSLLSCDYENFEVIVVNDGSTDQTPQILKRFSSRLKIITNSRNLGPSEARNTAAHEARGEFLAFTDADCIVHKDWLKELLAGFTVSDIVSVGGGQESPEDETVFGGRVAVLLKKAGFIADYMHCSRDITLVAHNPSCNVMYKKEVFLKEGGFWQGFWPGEDLEFDYRLKKNGHKLVFNPRAIVYHYRPHDMRSFKNMMYRYGRAQGFLVRRYGIFRKIQFLPFLLILFILALAFGVTSGFVLPSLLFLLMGVLCLVLYLKCDLNIIFMAIMAFFSWNAGFSKGLIYGFQSALDY